MKNISISLRFSKLFILVLSAALFFSSCDENDEPKLTKAEEVTALLISGTWKVGSALVDGIDRSSVYTGLSISFTSSGFTTINGGKIFPPSGSWEFTSDDATAIERNDGLVIDIISISESQLKLGFTWTNGTIGTGRVASVSGDHVLTFGK